MEFSGGDGMKSLDAGLERWIFGGVICDYGKTRVEIAGSPRLRQSNPSNSSHFLWSLFCCTKRRQVQEVEGECRKW